MKKRSPKKKKEEISKIFSRVVYLQSKRFAGAVLRTVLYTKSSGVIDGETNEHLNFNKTMKKS